MVGTIGNISDLEWNIHTYRCNLQNECDISLKKMINNYKDYLADYPSLGFFGKIGFRVIDVLSGSYDKRIAKAVVAQEILDKRSVARLEKIEF